MNVKRLDSSPIAKRNSDRTEQLTNRHTTIDTPTSIIWFAQKMIQHPVSMVCLRVEKVSFFCVEETKVVVGGVVDDGSRISSTKSLLWMKPRPPLSGSSCRASTL